MSLVAPSKTRLPHASVGPLWCPPLAEPAHEWHEIEMLLAMPESDMRSKRSATRSLHSVTIVAAALVLGGGILAATLMTPRMDCGAACDVATAENTTLQSAPGLDTTASLPAQPDTHVTEGRSAAEPPPGPLATAAGPDAAAETAAPEAMAAPAPRRRHHHHH